MEQSVPLRAVQGSKHRNFRLVNFQRQLESDTKETAKYKFLFICPHVKFANCITMSLYPTTTLSVILQKHTPALVSFGWFHIWPPLSHENLLCRDFCHVVDHNLHLKRDQPKELWG